eukprot:TRINITY_DN56540_c0_g1_i1.p1 TRINITY_DN56540_c0_g1~~TRINITY_DN56540_c0_g1_i1.p1  ORF type:complete len:342 (+),score=59.77 TRINITY_DN56540_c0_g1_i1:67-1026(+)
MGACDGFNQSAQCGGCGSCGDASGQSQQWGNTGRCGSGGSMGSMGGMAMGGCGGGSCGDVMWGGSSCSGGGGNGGSWSPAPNTGGVVGGLGGWGSNSDGGCGGCGGYSGFGGCGQFGGNFGGCSDGCGGFADGDDKTNHVGTVKSFDEEKGWGHISCSETRATYGKDIFVLRSSLRTGRASAGDQVQFTVHKGLKGPEARDVRPLGQELAVQPHHAANRVFNGRVKMFSAEKGWGFIACEETHQIYGKDIFVHKREFQDAGDMHDDDQVQFTVDVGKDGKPEARTVSRVGGGGSDGSSLMASYGALRQDGGAGGRTAPY